MPKEIAKRGIRLLVATFLLAGGLPAAHAAIPTTERDALIALYVATNGDGWADNSGWKTPPLAGDGFAMPGTECGWYSVWCDVGETTVEEIDLHGNLLSGSIPSEISDLTNLQYLFLSSNQLSGGIPSGLGSISTLLELSLYDNDLTGSIPPELGGLANLEILWIDGNDLTGSIPPELGDLANLQQLFLFNNQLSGGIPQQLGNLAGVTTLFLNGNQLSGAIPSQLGGLASVEELFLYLNQLSGTIPPELGGLATLRRLLINDNELVGPVPVEMMDLTSLQDNASDFCNNHLYTSDSALSSFLDTKQVGGDWESCQTAPVPAVPGAGILVLCALLAGSAIWAVGRTETATG